MSAPTGSIGKMRHEIVIQSRTQTPDTVGGFTETWAAFETVFADIDPVSASERFFSQKLEADITHKITIRYLETVTDNMRVLFGSRVFKIVGVFHLDERSTRTQLNCIEGAGV